MCGDVTSGVSHRGLARCTGRGDNRLGCWPGPTYPWRHACPERRRGRPCPAEVPRAPARRRAPRRHRRGDPRPPGRRRGRGDRLGQDDPAARRSASSSAAASTGPIGHTQPRRIAARLGRRADRRGDAGRAGRRSSATRCGSPTTAATRRVVKVMTDGILLAEMQRDRDLRRYDTIIIDEAHERRLNIDFILGYLKQLLPRRPDLKVVITSATIDPAAVRRRTSPPTSAARSCARCRSSRCPAAPTRSRSATARCRAAPRRPARGRRARPGDRGRRGRRGAVDRGAPEPRRHRHPRRSSRASGRSATPPTRSTR